MLLWKYSETQLQPNKGIRAPKRPMFVSDCEQNRERERELKMCRLRKTNAPIFSRCSRCTTLLEWHRARVNTLELTHPVSAPSCTLLGLILWVHPDRLTDAPVDSSGIDKHREPRSSAPFRARGRRKNVLKWPTCANKLAASSPRKY